VLLRWGASLGVTPWTGAVPLGWLAIPLVVLWLASVALGLSVGGSAVALRCAVLGLTVPLLVTSGGLPELAAQGRTRHAGEQPPVAVLPLLAGGWALSSSRVSWRWCRHR